MMRAARIKGIAVELPGNKVTNADLARLHPEWDMEAVEARAGVRERWFAGPDETAVDLAEASCRKLFEEYPAARRADTLIFCTQTPDYVLPASACVLQGRLGLPDSVFAFDLAMGCSGFVNGLALARSLVLSAQSRDLLLVTADTLSKRTSPEDRSVRVLFGDGAAATWIGVSEGEGGILDIECASGGEHFDRIIIPAGGCRQPSGEGTRQREEDDHGNWRSAEEVFMDGLAVLGLVSSKVPPQIRTLVERNSLSLDQVDAFAFHQASKVALDSLQSLLGLPPGKVLRNLERVGNTVSASIPIVLKEAMESGRLREGNLLVASGFGVGLAWASALVRW